MTSEGLCAVVCDIHRPMKTPVDYDESPYSASTNEVCELVMSAAMGLSDLRRCVSRLRGIEVSLPNPKGYVYYVGEEADTILTSCDMQFWRMHPLMFGEVCVIGTLGVRQSFIWDRNVLAVNALGMVYLYELHKGALIVQVADNLSSLIANGMSEGYMQVQKNLRNGISPKVLDTCKGVAFNCPWLPPSLNQWMPIDVGGVVCAKVPAEKIRRGLKLRLSDLSDLTDGVFKSAAPSWCP
nr:tegument protein UL26 [Mastomys natalensis cytomegalovirus 3]WEG69859.1 tegument protein UL26 [Mastomys natalensis cytomegalovirus 3]WEG69999.1 tegument protein UL26 [Mastomys natalensis cytomegalovirus 3]WEG70139.1 tegument protein UL26 [Mastomys natalensis cytomegalovirus 3]WEG70279.1 tegument protein UL26 [Mastomys natalensis cytomegalovirus 3]